MSAQTLSELFGAAGEHYWRLAHGIDARHMTVASAYNCETRRED
jgi:hypothetical protein